VVVVVDVVVVDVVGAAVVVDVVAPAVVVGEAVAGDTAGRLLVALWAYVACMPVRENDDTTGTANAVPTTIFFRNERRSSATRSKISLFAASSPMRVRPLPGRLRNARPIPVTATGPSDNALRVLQQVTRRFEEERERTAPVPDASPPGPARHLTIGMATYDDYDGVFFTIEAIRLYHPEVLDDLEFVLIDNHPEGAAAADLAGMAQRIPGMRYVPFRAWRGTASRDLVFREARGEHVVCLDAHVLLVPGALAAIDKHLGDHPDDLVQGPLLFEDGTPYGTHFEPEWRAGMYGRWGIDDQMVGTDAFEIPMCGLGMFACRRDRWPGFHPHLRGFGGEEGYLHEKFRRAGGRTVCLPAAGWVHRFARPLGLPYVATWDDRLRNYLLIWDELGLDPASVDAHFRELLGDEVVEPILREIVREMESPMATFDAIVCIQRDANVDDWPDVWARFQALGVGRVVERFAAIETPDNHHDGCARSHRAVIAEAKRRGLANVLVVEEDAIFLDDTLAVLARALEQLDGRAWDLLYLGGVHRRPPVPVDGSDTLQRPTYLTCTHAVVYHSDAFDRLLEEIPAEPAEFAVWLATYAAIDQYLPRRVEAGVFQAFVVTPRVASQPALLNYDDGDRALAPRYTIT